MGFTKEQIEQMVALESAHDFQTLFGAMCIIGIKDVNNMFSEFLYDEKYVKENGMPTINKMIEATIAQMAVILPLAMSEDDAVFPDLSSRDGETPMDLIIRGYINQLIKQLPWLVEISYQPQ